MPKDPIIKCPCGARGCLSTITHRNTRKHTEYELTNLYGPIVQCPCGGEYRQTEELSHKNGQKHQKFEAGPPIKCECGGEYLSNQKEEHMTSAKHRRFIRGPVTARQAWANKIVVCECCGHFNQVNKARHEKTAKHIEFVGSLPTTTPIVNQESLKTPEVL